MFPSVNIFQERNPGYKGKNFAFVIGQLGIIQRDSDSNLKAFRRAVIGKRGIVKAGSTRKGLYRNLIARILNVTLKGSLDMYRWFRTGDLGIISGHLVIKEAKQEQQKLSSWTAKYLRPEKLRLSEPQDPSLRKDGSTIRRIIVEKVKEAVVKKEAK